MYEGLPVEVLGRDSLVDFVKTETRRSKRTLVDVQREAGLNADFVHHAKRHRSMNMDAAIALLNSLGYRLMIAPLPPEN